MANISFYISGKNVPPPDNWQSTDIELSFENDSPDASVRTQVFEWLGDNAAELNKWFKNGTKGGVGAYEGPSFQIKVCSPELTVFDGCIDLASDDTDFTCDKVRAAVKETGRIDILNDRAQGVEFSYLRAINVITPADYIAIPYVISNVPDYAQIAVLSISLMQILHILQETFTNLSNLLTKFTNDLANVPFTTALIVGDAVMIILYLIYMLAMIALVVGLVNMIISNFIQPVKYKFGMRVQTLFDRACAHLGYTFSSTILKGPIYHNLVYIPKKQGYINDATFLETFFSNTFTRKFYDDTKNANAYGYYEGDFSQFIREMEDVFNAKVVLRGNTMYFERWDHWNLNAVFQMPPQSSEAPFEDPYSTNAGELASNYRVKWALDPLDCSTYDQYDGTSCQMTLEPIVTINKKNILLRNLTAKDLAFALAKRKNKLTGAEDVTNFIFNIIAPFYNVAVGIINAVTFITGGGNKIPSIPKNPLNARLGHLTLCSDFTGVPKLLVIDSGDQVHPSNQVYTAAHTLQLGYHSASWAIDIFNNDHNQYLTFKEKEIPLCCSDFQKIRDNNIIKDVQNRFGRITSLRWNPHEETAIINFRVKSKWTTNLTQKLVIDGI